MLQEFGFRAIKLKGGVLPPDEEIDTVLALRDAFPDAPASGPEYRLERRDVHRGGTRLDGVLEYLEDPTPGLTGMAEVARAVPMPLATNMCVVGFEDVAPALARASVQVILADHHYWGGLTRSRDSPRSATRSTWGCRCTRTPTSGSVSPR